MARRKKYDIDSKEKLDAELEPVSCLLNDGKRAEAWAAFDAVCLRVKDLKDFEAVILWKRLQGKA